MITQIVATERDGLDTRTFAIRLEVFEKVDVQKAVEAACKEYCLTEEGKRTFEGNCCSFNWGDFEAYVPNEICEKHGFRKLAADYTEEVVPFDQQLVNEEDIFPDPDVELD